MNCCTYLVEGISISGGDVLLIDAIRDNIAVKEFLKREQGIKLNALSKLISTHKWFRIQVFQKVSLMLSRVGPSKKERKHTYGRRTIFDRYGLLACAYFSGTGRQSKGGMLVAAPPP